MKKSVALLTAFCFLLLEGCSFEGTWEDWKLEPYHGEIWDITYVVPSTTGGGEDPNFEWRRDSEAPGLNVFSPADTCNLANHDSARNIFLDVLAQKKNAKVGSRYPIDLWNFWHSNKTPPVITESFESAADYYEKSFSKAEAGEDDAYTAFTRLEDVDTGYITAYHYTYEKPGPGPEDPLQESGVDLIYERWGEQYLFETEKNIYVFALSTQGENRLASKVLREVVDSIRVGDKDSSKGNSISDEAFGKILEDIWEDEEASSREDSASEKYE